jgi:hypothetical protein
MKKVDIRFNTNFPSKSLYEWRVLIDGIETLVNNVEIEVPCYTTSTFIEGHGMKWHISTNANEVEFDNSLITNKIAIIK